LNVLPGGDSASGSQLDDSLQALTDLVRSWEPYGLQGWARKSGTISLTATTASYTFGSAGTGLTERPTKIEGAWLRDSDSQDSSLYIMTRNQYWDITDKAEPGVCASVYYDSQAPTATIYLWPVPEDSTYSLLLDYRKPLAELDSGTDSLEMPPEWHRTLKWNLAAELAMEWGLKDIPQGVQAKADSTLALLIGMKEAPNQPIVGWPDEAYDA
jgi:hypothetical protein